MSHSTGAISWAETMLVNVIVVREVMDIARRCELKITERRIETLTLSFAVQSAPALTSSIAVSL